MADMTPEQIAAVAGKLTKAQRETILEMSDQPSWGIAWFAFSQEFPKLVESVQTRAQCISYYLTPLGLAVRDHLEKESWS